MKSKSGRSIRKELEERLRFETLIAEISSRFVNVPADEIDREIEDAQREICECLQIDGAALWQVSPEEPNSPLLTHIYRVSGVPARPARMTADQTNPWMASRALAGQIVAVSDTMATPPEASKDRETWGTYSIRSALALPLSVGRGPVTGVLTFAAVRKRREWPEDLQKRLQLIADIFANALERHRYEQKLRESEARLALAADCANAGFWILDPESGRIWATDKAFEILGIASDSDLTLAQVVAMIHPDDREAVNRSVGTAITSERDSVVEYRIQRPDGTIRWLSSRGRIHSQPNAGQHLLMGVTTDITESKLLEQEHFELSGQLMNAAEEERARIARELHDDIGSSISALGIRLEIVARSIRYATKSENPELSQLRADVTQLGQKVSEVSHRLHSAELDLLGLPTAAAAACRKTEELSGILVKCRCDGVAGFREKEIESCLFRVLQEALNNAVKYSRANQIEVDLTASNSRLQLKIADDGAGFAWNDPARRHGLGLVGMSERMRLVGGTLRIDASPGRGTTIHAIVPIITKVA